jgi:hypothetical protein
MEVVRSTVLGYGLKVCPIAFSNRLIGYKRKIIKIISNVLFKTNRIMELLFIQKKSRKFKKWHQDSV